MANSALSLVLFFLSSLVRGSTSQCASWGSTSLHVSDPAPNSECYWFRECSDHTQCLKFHFSSFDMETDYDYVYLCE